MCQPRFSSKNKISAEGLVMLCNGGGFQVWQGNCNNTKMHKKTGKGKPLYHF
jgi:hypothetical protein